MFQLEKGRMYSFQPSELGIIFTGDNIQMIAEILGTKVNREYGRGYAEYKIYDEKGKYELCCRNTIIGNPSSSLSFRDNGVNVYMNSVSFFQLDIDSLAFVKTYGDHDPTIMYYYRPTKQWDIYLP